MANIYKVTLNQQLLLLSHIFIVYGFLGGVYLYYYGFIQLYIGFIYATLFFFFIDILPAIVLHVQYLRVNYKAILVIDTEMKVISYKNSVLNVNYSFDDIVTIERFSSYGFGMGWYSFGEYRYYKITFKGGSTIIVTCLLIHDIDRTIELLLKMPVKKKGRIIALL